MSISFDAAIQSFKPQLPLAVALSGGADSTALLIACAARWPGQVQAFHVHHGLQAAADGFEAHCRALCERLAVPLLVRHVDARNANGQSPEDAARQARYGALEDMLAEANGIRSIALAQHADDQIETILLALSRGAGVAGIAAMPMQWQRAGVEWHRPLLKTGGAEIREWLKEQGSDWVEDPTNADERYTRNRIRRNLLPALQSTFPQFRETFARSAEHAAQAAELLQELAEQDLQTVGNPPSIKALQGLSRTRQANVLRHWLRLAHATTPSAAQLGALLDQVAACTTRGHRIHLKIGRGYIERKDGLLDWYN